MGLAGCPCGVFSWSPPSTVQRQSPAALMSPARASRRFGIFAEAAHFAIHVLETGQREWLARFARGGAGFDGLDHSVTTEGLPSGTDLLHDPLGGVLVADGQEAGEPGPVRVDIRGREIPVRVVKFPFVRDNTVQPGI